MLFIHKHTVLKLMIPVGLLQFSTLFSQIFKTQREALQQAFPASDSIERKVLFLSDEQVDEIQKAARAKLDSKLVTYYVAFKNDTTLGYALFESTIVRTKVATFMAVINPDSSLKLVDILAFHEPMDYLPRHNWFDLFIGKILSPELWPKRDIHNVTGATLTVQAITVGVRKMLAIFEVAIAKEQRQ